jgi:hypothetical protein
MWASKFSLAQIIPAHVGPLTTASFVSIVQNTDYVSHLGMTIAQDQVFHVTSQKAHDPEIHCLW